jgi:DNA polymerase III gamma/tau subunit
MQQEFRPQKIEEIFGQEHIKPMLYRWLSNPQEIPKSILLHGPYGCSKTTIARMLAKTLAHEQDIMEMNAAAARGIDDVRDIADNTAFSGLSGNKVYIIDELHMMTPAAQSALLKVIEEPKEGIYFILCTTDYAKLLDTIRSRCTKLEVKLLTEQEAFSLMQFLNPQISEDLMVNIYLASGGHARDIVKSVAVGISHPQVITQAVANIASAQSAIAKWYKGENSEVWAVLAADESALRMLCDYVCDNPAILGAYFTKENYHQLLVQRANSLLYLVTQKQRYIHAISLRY